MIIDIEGTDGSGKATQTKMLYDYLVGKGYKCKLLSFPNYESRSSEPVKMYLNGELGENNDLNGYQASSLFAIDRMITMINFDLSQYDYVLFDRYTPSNMVHQSTRIKDKAELDRFLDWVADFEYVKLRLPKPDVIAFLDVPIEVSMKLAKGRDKLKCGEAKDILESDPTHLIMAYNNAKYVAEKFDWLRVDCVTNGEILSREKIQNKIRKSLNIE